MEKEKVNFEVTPINKIKELSNTFIEFIKDEKGIITFTEENKLKLRKLIWNVADSILFEVYADKNQRRFWEDVKEEVEKCDYKDLWYL